MDEAARPDEQARVDGEARPDEAARAHPAKRASRRSDARQNRERILAAALTELTRSPDAPVSAIARRAGVGQGTFYRNFPDRQALLLELYRHELEQVADGAAELLRTRPPDLALREWMDRLARFAMAKAGIADAMQQAVHAPAASAKPGRDPVASGAGLLLRAAQETGAVRADVTVDDFTLAIAGLWHIDPRSDWQPRAARLLDLVMDALRTHPEKPPRR